MIDRYTKCKGFMLFGGDDATSRNFVLAGGHGVMSVTGNLNAFSHIYIYISCSQFPNVGGGGPIPIIDPLLLPSCACVQSLHESQCSSG